MEAAIRWSPHSTADFSRFLVLDVEENNLQYFELASNWRKKGHDDESRFKLISQKKKLPNYTAFDWSKTDPNLIAIGASIGETHLVQLGSSDSLGSASEEGPSLQTLGIKHQRKCNSIAFSHSNKLATGLDRVRSDSSLNIYELTSSGVNLEPNRKLVIGEAVTSIRFFTSQPDVLIAGVRAQCVRLYDLRGKWTLDVLSCAKPAWPFGTAFPSYR